MCERYAPVDGVNPKEQAVRTVQREGPPVVVQRKSGVRLESTHRMP